MKKKTLSLFLVLVMCLTLMPTGVFAQDTASGQTTEQTATGTDPEQQEIPSGGGTSGDRHTHDVGGDSVDFQAWDKSDAMPTDEGNYYLMKDVTLSETWTPAGSTILDLNGHNITIDLGTDGTYNDKEMDVIGVDSSVSFTLYDCEPKGKAGKITHETYKYTSSKGDELTIQYYGRGVNNIGTFNMYGGCITGNRMGEGSYGAGVRNANRYFNMYGGTISGNIANQGGAIFNVNGGSMNMTGGIITGNAATAASSTGIVAYGGGGGIYNNYGGTLTVSGDVKITGNVCNSNVQDENGFYIKDPDRNESTYNNVLVASEYDTYYPIKVAGKLESDASIGMITCNAPKSGTTNIVVEGTNGYTLKQSDFLRFFSDVKYELVFDSENNRINITSNKANHLNPDGSGYEHAVTSDSNGLNIDGSTSDITTGTYTDNGTNKSADYYELTAGTYYLDGDTKLDKILYVKSGTVKLCLNGHSLTGSSAGPVFIVGTGATLEISDCGSKGCITGGSNMTLNGFGGAVFNNGTFVLKSGIIKGNKAVFGGAISNSSGATVKLLGGSIINNTTAVANLGSSAVNGKYSGGAVYNAGTLEISGDVAISNNTDSSGNPSKGIMLENNAKITVTGELTGKNAISVGIYSNRTLAGGVFTTGWNTYMSGKSVSAYFTSDSSDYNVYKSGNELMLSEHYHPVCGKDVCDEHNSAQWTGISSLSEIKGAGNYYLKNDIAISSAWTPVDGVNLCLNGMTIRDNGSSVGSVIDLAEGVNFTLTDCNERYSGIIEFTGTYYGRGVIVEKGATFTMYDGSISYNDTAGNVNLSGAGVSVDGGTFDMYGGKITGNKAFYGGGVGISNEGIFNMHGGIITDNRACDGAGVYIGSRGSGTFNMYGGQITKNEARPSSSIGGDGAGVYVNNSESTFNMYGGEITENTAYGYGSVYVDEGTFSMSGGKITGNSGSEVAGGIYVRPAADFTVDKKVNITGNTAGENSVECNVYLAANDTKNATIAIGENLDADSRIGVTLAPYISKDKYPIKFATGATDSKLDYTKIFTTDVTDKGYSISRNESENALYFNRHDHSWKYAADNTAKTITAICTGEDCTLENKNGGTVTFSAPLHKIYGDGQSASAAYVKSENVSEELPTPVLEYYKRGETTALAAAPVNAGDYTVKGILGDASVTIDYTIAPKTVTEFTATEPASLTYNGAEQTCPEFKVTVDNTELTKETDYTVTGDTATDAGDYKLKITFCGNYADQAGQAAEVSWEIKPLAAAIVWNDYENRTYGDGKTVTATVSNKIGSDDVTVVVSGGAETAVGNYTATATGLSGTKAKNYTLEGCTNTTQAYTIGKVAAKVTKAPEAKALTYNGTAQELISTGTAEDGTMMYSTSENGIYSETIPTGTDASAYEIWYKVEGDSNHSSVAPVKMENVSITKRIVKLQGVTVNDKVYDGSAAAEIASNGSLENVVENDDVAYTVAGTFADANVGKDKNVTLTVTLTGSKAGNYGIASDSQVTAKASITAKEVTVSGITAVSRDYAASDKTVKLSADNAKVDGTVGSDTVTVDITDVVAAMYDDKAGNNKPVAITGVKLSGDNGNYVLKEQPTGVTVNISKADGSVTAPTAAADLVYNGSEQMLINEAVSSTGEVQYKRENGTYGIELPKAVNAGSYKVYYKVIGDENHNDVAEQSIEVTVNKAKLIITVKDKSAYVNDKAPDLSKPEADKDYTVSGLIENEKMETAPILKYFDSEGKEMEAPDMTKAGTVTIAASGASAGDNYTVEYKTGTLTINNRRSSSSSSTPKYTVTAPKSTTGGSVKSDVSSAAGGSTVTVTVTAEEGYKIGGLKVTDSKGNEIRVTDKGNGKYTFTMPSDKVELTPVFTKEASEVGNELPFRDVAKDAYYYEAVKWAKDNGITGGVRNDLFGSNASCTRGHIVTFLWRNAGSPEPKSVSSFSDVASNSYYSKAVAWAVENGITNGVGHNKFAPDAACTRAQSVAFLYRAIGKQVSSKAHFSDVPSNSYYADAVAWAAANDVTNGIGSGLFGSDNSCTRAQIVTFLYRAYQNRA